MPEQPLLPENFTKKACPLTIFQSFQGQALNLQFTCGTTLLRHLRNALSQSASTLLTLNAGAALLNTLAQLKRFDSTLNGPFTSLHLYPASTCPNSLKAHLLVLSPSLRFVVHMKLCLVYHSCFKASMKFYKTG